MRGFRRLLMPALLSVLTLVAYAGDDEPRVPDAWVEEALEAADDHALELEKVLAHFATADDLRKLVAARFLVANMAGHGYVLTEFRSAEEEAIEFDPLAYETYKEARAALEAIEKERGELHVARERIVEDLKTIQADYLIRHVNEAFAAWEACPDAQRVGFDAFLNYVLPYRGSQEPLDFWIGPLRDRYGGLWAELDGDVGAIRKHLSRDVHKRVRFNERYYMHPTDQGFKEMVVSGQGRCEDITNMMTFCNVFIAITQVTSHQQLTFRMNE